MRCARVCGLCRVVDASTLRKLNVQLDGQAAKPNMPESLWIPPNGATQVRRSHAGSGISNMLALLIEL